MGLDGQLGEDSTYGDMKLYSTKVSSALRSRSTKMGDGEYAVILDMQSFGTYCKDLFAMIEEPHALPSFAT